jgi:hypothetical protein
MKTLLTIIILTISVNIYGQELIMYDVDTLPELAYELADHKYELVQLLLPILNEYKQDCYNDSTLEHTHIASWVDKCYIQTGNLADGYEFVLVCDDSTHYEWIHKEPTFADFIEWLNKY